jgi:hypothetical protein
MNATSVRLIAGALACATFSFSGANARPLDIIEDRIDLTEELCVRCISARARSMPLEAALEFDLALTERRQIALATRMSRFSDRTDFFEVAFFDASAQETPVTTPAPAAIGLLLTGLAGLGFLRRRRA